MERAEWAKGQVDILSEERLCVARKRTDLSCVVTHGILVRYV